MFSFALTLAFHASSIVIGAALSSVLADSLQVVGVDSLVDVVCHMAFHAAHHRLVHRHH